MKSQSFSKFLLNLSFFSLTFLCLAGISASDIQAQKGSKSFDPSRLLAEAADIDQCRNGEVGSEVPCVDDAWVNGNAGPQNSHYKEGDSVAYRYRLTDLTPNTPNQITIAYDTIHSDVHALDYLTTYNRTEGSANPCSDILSAAICGSPTTFPIPIDPNVVNNNLTGVQIPGVFTFYGGTITSVSGYTDFPQGGGSVRTRITIFFTPTIPNPILAVGGHIATRADWGADNSAVSISGSPYHMRLIDLNGSGGNQDRSLKVDDFTTSVTVIKDIANGTSSTGFGFTANAGLPGSFTLTDDGNNNAIDSTPRGISSGDLSPSGTITITENDPFGTGFQLLSISCTGTAAANVTTVFGSRQVTVNVQNNESVTCTFTNGTFAPTAANAMIIGRVVDSGGRAIWKARVSLIDSDGEIWQTKTNPFGYYSFEDLPAGKTYVVEGFHKRYTFSPLVINLSENLNAPDLIGQ